LGIHQEARILAAVIPYSNRHVAMQRYCYIALHNYTAGTHMHCFANKFYYSISSQCFLKHPTYRCLSAWVIIA